MYDIAAETALKVAENSTCKKRKVGAVVTNKDYMIISTGWNVNNIKGPCEDTNGNTKDTVDHAEIAAIRAIMPFSDEGASYIFVTHQPCKNCQAAIDEAGLEVVLVESFMKFDAGKLRYSLIPPEATKALASVLTYGAKKYKPNNWKRAEDTERYVDALYRHLESWRSGEKFDDESKLSHLSHALTNIAFLIYFEEHKLGEDSRSEQNSD